MCEHLIPLDEALNKRGLTETYRGQPWSKNCREWVYYDCVLNLEKLRHRYALPAFVEVHFNDDAKSGMEAGFVCSRCNDGVIGVHPHFGNGKIIVE